MPPSSSESPKAAILAVGTELTTGQITNRNAAWLSERLEELGAEVVLHETVPDDRASIAAALDRCVSAGALVFVTGGLGPTSDDFTREAIASWLGLELHYDEASWKRIEARLGRFGIAVAESNRQQCYFPEGSTILINEAGTANGFSCRHGAVKLWVLPGPPREVEAVWLSGVRGELRGLLPEAPARTLLTWQCVGNSEAALGELTEAALQGSGLEIGYRAHRPFVEIKVWVPGNDPGPYRVWLDRLEAAVAPWLITRQGEDLAARFIRALPEERTCIHDGATRGVLAERLGAYLRDEGRLAEEKKGPLELRTVWGESSSGSDSPAGVGTVFGLSWNGSLGEWTLDLRRAGAARSETFKSPYRTAELADRNHRLIAELFLKVAADWLVSSSRRTE